MGGCTASKLDNEDTVRRCKERKRLIKDAVNARHHLSAAHSDYLRSLRLTGSALLEFASGEPLSVSNQTPTVFLHTKNPTSFTHKDPPPPFNPNLTRTQSSISYQNSDFVTQTPKLTKTHSSPLKGYSYFEENDESSSPTITRSKVPHILSESSPNFTPNGMKKKVIKKKSQFGVESNYSETQSQASSVWNWENFYPPSPPGSDFFRKNSHLEEEEDNQSKMSSSVYSKQQQQQHHHLKEELEEEEREEVQCSEWGDHYSTTSSDTDDENDDDDEEDLESRSEMGSRSNFGSSVHNGVGNKSMGHAQFDQKSDFDAGSSVSWNMGNKSVHNHGGGGGGGGGGEIADMKLVVRHKDLAEIAACIKEYFEKAAVAGEPVSDLLEISRAQLDRSFRQLKKTVYHSNSLLTNLSSSWTSKPPLEIKYRLDTGALVEQGPKSHFSTLEQLLAWEKKLYQEVKAREGANIEHEKKLSTLQSLEYRGGGEAKLDKTKASIKKLQSMILVTSQSVSTTSSAIVQVRDTELTPQLVEICHGLMYMWRSMNHYHELQNNIVQQVRGLINRADKGESTTELHRQATRHLESAVSSWHSSFCRLIKYQRDYIQSLHSWIKLSLQPIKDITTTEPTTNPANLFAFLDEWKQALDRLPDTVASESIKSFVNVVHVITTKQTEELKVKKRGEIAVKELEKKASSLRTIEKKFYQSYSMVGIAMPDSGRQSDGGPQVFDARDPLSEKKMDLAACQRKVEDEMTKYAKAVEVTRAMTLNNIQTGLPGVFQSMTMFSSLFNETLQGVCTRSYSISR
ncbi:hypothetical protein C5167_040998 [Papaver somniferum]|uniref:DUF632 domain-containing protein n=1 Tax=Papaver somniferum TaxID=3469 RepID=A0A4Y7IKR8_PAPSO|nr:nitrate regulatory gene2 protein-like [Papaver somniferum]RZC48059.1 hypothetical protein C5167_040998 [Papaver somniferum]